MLYPRETNELDSAISSLTNKVGLEHGQILASLATVYGQNENLTADLATLTGKYDQEASLNSVRNETMREYLSVNFDSLSTQVVTVDAVADVVRANLSSHMLTHDNFIEDFNVFKERGDLNLWPKIHPV